MTPAETAAEEILVDLQALGAIDADIKAEIRQTIVDIIEAEFARAVERAVTAELDRLSRSGGAP